MSGLLGTDGRPIEAGGPRLLGPDGHALRPRPEDNTKPSKVEAEEFVRILEEAAMECFCKLPVMKDGGKGWDCAACGRHAHVRLTYRADPERAYCGPGCRDTAQQAA